MEELGKERPNVPARSAIRWRHVSLNAARARGYGGRSASSRSFRCHGRAHSLTDRKLGRMVRKVACGGRTGSGSSDVVSEGRSFQGRSRASCTRSRRGSALPPPALLARRVPVTPQDIAVGGESAAHRPVQFLTADLVRLHRPCARAVHRCRTAHAAVAIEGHAIARKARLEAKVPQRHRCYADAGCSELETAKQSHRCQTPWEFYIALFEN